MLWSPDVGDELIRSAAVGGVVESFSHFVGDDAYNLEHLRSDLDRFAFCLATTANDSSGRPNRDRPPSRSVVQVSRASQSCTGVPLTW